MIRLEPKSVSFRLIFMRRPLLALVLLTVLLSACSPSELPTRDVAPELEASAPTESIPTLMTGESPTVDVIPAATTEIVPPKLIVTLSTPHIDQGPDGAITEEAPTTQPCAYQWAYQDLPQLSSDFLQAVQQLQPEAQATAFAFGENCVRADGSATFLAMETDFNLTLQVSDLADTSELGDWIVNVMQIVQSIPPDQIVGPRPGRVSIIFQSSGEQNAVKFYIDQYANLPSGLSSAEVYQALQTAQ